MHGGESQVDFYYNEEMFNRWRRYFVDVVQSINTLFLLTFIEQFEIINQNRKEAIWAAVPSNKVESLKETRERLMSGWY